jgi:uncharacterized delta-60 repeat protein/LPXTG-motif cell wall-anchored protein
MLSSQLMSSLLTSVNLKGEQMSVFKGRFGRWAKAFFAGAVAVSAVAVLQAPSSPVSATTADQRDVSFSTNATAAMPPNVLLNAMVELPDGKWMLATGAGLVRLNANGSKDSSYLGNYDTPTTGVTADVKAMDVDANGGVIYSSGSAGGRLARLNPDGSPDSGFAFDEGIQSPFLVNAPFNATPTAIKVLANGDILVAGEFNNTNTYGSAGLVKMTSAGDPVAAFNTNVGNAWFGVGQFATTAPHAYDIEVDAQGRILLASMTYTPVPMLVRFSANGTPDTTFNTTLGNWIGTTSNSEGYDVEPLADGGYLLVGVQGYPTFGFAVGVGHPLYDPSSPTCVPQNLFRVEANGSSNTSYNGTEDVSQSADCVGWSQRTVVGGSLNASLRVANFYSEFGGVSVDPNGDIVVAGRFTDPIPNSFESGLARFGSNGQFVSLAEQGAANWTGWQASTSRPIRLVAKSAAGENIVALSVFYYSGSAWVTDVKIRKYSAAPVPVPTVTSVSPTSGSTAGGTAITITGTNLGSALTVTVGSAACTNVVVVSATSITCTTPPGTAGTASIIVTAGSQSNVANTLFTYNAPTTTTTAPAVTTTTTTTAPAVTTTTTAPAVTTTTTAPATAPTSSTAPATTAPATTAPVGPVNVTSSNQATLTQTPGAATAVVNGQPVTVAVETPADLPAAQVDPEDRSPAQVAALQTAADNLVSQLNQSAGGNSGLAVQDTPTGAAITGLLDKPVPIENTVLVEAGTKSTLFAALNQDGSVTEVQPGAVIEVLGDGQVGVVASGLTPGETAEFVIMSTPTLLGSYTVSANGTIKAQTSLPDGIGLGNHTLVVASPTVQASLGLKVSATPSTLPATGATSNNTMQIALFLMVGGLMVAYLRRRRHILN